MSPDRALRRAIVVTVAAVVMATVALLWAAIGRDGTVETTQPPGTPPSPLDSQPPPGGGGQSDAHRGPSSAFAVVPGQAQDTPAGGPQSVDGRGASTTSSSTTSTTAPRTRPVHKPAFDGDVDGDGRTDRVTLVPGVGSNVQVVAMLTTVGPQEVTVQARSPKLMGVVDMNGDGFAEIVLRADRQGFDEDGVWGAALTLVDDRLREVVRAAGGAWRFAISSNSGLECSDVDSREGVEVVTTQADNSGTSAGFQPSSRPTMTRQVHRLVGSMIESVGEPEEADGSPEVACGSLPPTNEWDD